ncbi:MAG: glycosyl transferase, group 1 [Frankiales bacterium]|nr:glycosyl transferase, group 1 [Frankiales bacterium]
MRVTLDGTPLLGVRTGIGRYTASLLEALARTSPIGEELRASAFTLRGHGRLAGALPAGVRTQGRAAPARVLQEAWARSEWPPVELVSGPTDIYHATNYVLPPLRRARGVVNVHDLTYLHSPDLVDPTSRRYQALVPRSIARASAVLALSQAVADQIQEAYAPRVPVVPIALGVDPLWATASAPDDALRQQLGLPSSYLLFVGTQEPRKNLATLLRAHALLPDAPPLVLVGARGWGNQLDVSGCITPGYLDDAALSSVVAGAAAVILPSHDEGFGLPVLEALAAGTPVVASDLAAHREVGGEVAVYAPPGDPEAIAAALVGVLDAPGDPGPRRRHAAPFTWERTATATRAVYQQVMA